jgi:[ribosomal protein S18]-alanine N-acetyltransferase
MSVAIRAATTADVDAVIRLERGSGAPHWSGLDYLAIFSGVGPQRCLLVAEEFGGLVGFAVGKVLLDEAELETVAVAIEARRGGIGRSLCVAVKQWCATQGAALMALEVRAGNVGAIALYAGMGFVEAGRRAGYYRNPVEDAVLMRLELK